MPDKTSRLLLLVGAAALAYAAFLTTALLVRQIELPWLLSRVLPLLSEHAFRAVFSCFSI